MAWLFPFINKPFNPRVPSPEGAFTAIRDTGDNNARNVFEAHWSPPQLDWMNTLQRVGLSPGPEGAAFLPFLEAPLTPYIQQAGILTQAMDSDNPLYQAPESAPESQIF